MGQTYWYSGTVSTLGLLENELTEVVSDSATPDYTAALQAPMSAYSCAALHLLLCPVKADEKQAMAAAQRGRGLVRCALHLAQLTGLIMIVC